MEIQVFDAPNGLKNQDLSHPYSQDIADGIDIPLKAIKRACDMGNITELSRLLGPVLLATTAKSALWHLRSASIEERKLGTQQVKAIMPFIAPKLEQLELKNPNGAVAPDIASYMAFINAGGAQPKPKGEEA